MGRPPRLYIDTDPPAFIGLNISFKKVVLPGRVKFGGTEEDIVVAHGCRKRKKLICGPEEEIVVAHGRLPSPAH